RRSGRQDRRGAGRPDLLPQWRSARSGHRQKAGPFACDPGGSGERNRRRLAERIPSIPGSSGYFLGGFVTYTRRMKIDLLGVPAEILDEFGTVSAQTAEVMATRARLRTGATWGLSITGNAGPTADDEKAPVGM